MKNKLLKALALLSPAVLSAGAAAAFRLREKKALNFTIPDCLIDLHLHLDGSLSVESVKQLAAMQNIEIPRSDEEIKKLISLSGNCRDLNEYLEKFTFALSLLQTKEAISQAVYNLEEELKQQGLIYAEIRFAPQRHCDKGLTQEDAVLAAIEGMNRSDFRSNLILCCMREDGNREANLETLRLADKYRDMGVCAADIAGDEGSYPMESFRYYFDECKRLGLRNTTHAVEAAGPENVHKAILFETERIGHGIRSYEDLRVLKEVVARQVPLEFCPTSNLNTSIFESIEKYPLKQFLYANACVTVNTDNMSVSDTSLRRELQLLVDTFGLKKADVKKLLLNSAKASFARETVKAELIEEIEKAFE